MNNLLILDVYGTKNNLNDQGLYHKANNGRNLGLT